MSKHSVSSKQSAQITVQSAKPEQEQAHSYQKYIPAILCVLLGIWYWWFHSVSEGLYQHDEAGHTIDMLAFWDRPLDTIINMWSRGGYKILYSLSALIGEKAIVLTNILFTCGSAWLAYLVAREYKLSNSWLAILFFGLQPFIINLSFRSYAEVPTMFFTILFLYLYLKEKYVLAAIVVSFLFTLRQEMAVFIALFGLLMLFKRKWLPVILLVWAPLTLGLVGWYKTGSPTFIIDTVLQGGFSDTYQRNGFFYLWLMLPEILGIVIVLFFLTGYISIFTGGKEEQIKKLKKYHGVLLIFSIYFLMHCVFTSKSFGFGRSGGLGRFMIVVSPYFAVIALIGFNFFKENLVKQKTKITVAAVSAGILFLFLLMQETIMPHVFGGLVVTGLLPENYFFLIVAAIAVLLLIYISEQKKALAIGVAVCVSLYALFAVKPVPLNVEDETMKYCAEWFWNSPLASREVHATHILVQYYGLKNGADYKKVKSFDSTSLVNAKKGEIFIFENHYAIKNVSSALLDSSKLNVVQQFNVPGSNFAAFVLEKQ